LEVHDVLEANQFMIKNFMKWWIEKVSKKKGRKLINLDEVINRAGKKEAEVKAMIEQIPRTYANSIKEETGLTDDIYMICYANSKFMVVDEMTHAEQMSIIKYDEFLEFIVRVADRATFKGQTAGWTTPPEEDLEEVSDKEYSSCEEEK
jgi:hypothetical protein